MKMSLGSLMQNRTHEELVEIIEKQNDLIIELANANAELENMINVLLGDEFS